MRPRAVLTLAAVLVVILAVVMVSCGGSSDSTDTSASTTTSEESTTTSEESTTTSEESTATSKKPPATSSPTTVGTVSVPNVGFPMSEAEARSALAAVGLAASSSYVSSTGSMDYGKVVGQDPAPGTIVAIGSTVNITVHGTGQKAEVPDLIGMTQGDAENACFARYLHCHTNHVSGKPPGIVFGQTPAAGTLLGEGSSVTIDVGI